MASVMMSPSRRAGVGERPWARAVTRVAGAGQLSPQRSRLHAVARGGVQIRRRRAPPGIAGPGSGNVRFKNCPPTADSQLDVRGRT